MDQVKRKKTRLIRVGNVMIGGDAPVAIQSMTNTRTSDIDATLNQIKQLTEAGCELVRLAVPDETTAKAISELARRSPIPLIADIHFDSRLACLAIENGASKIRINPGNIGGRVKLLEVIHCAQRFRIPIRIGVNAGSLEREILQKYGEASAAALVDSALGYLTFFEEIGFQDLVVSIKASDVFTTIEACRIFSEKSSYPLHLGVTEAGPLEAGTIKNAVGIGTLLAEGIGDTIRVSLTASPVEEIKVARGILQALNLRRFEPELISCPTCGRCEVDLVLLVKKVEDILKKYKTPIKVAVMGCAVNGPGEAREADIGISAGKKQGILFRRGKVIRTVDFDKLLDALLEELDLQAASDGRSYKRGLRY
jgi:(E)-4-hydroxy-3-methylbut-2-enyl-diphosphate synthase